MRDREPGDAIVLDNVGGTPEGRSVGDTPNHEGNTDIGQDDDIALLLGEEDGVGCKEKHVRISRTPTHDKRTHDRSG